jgi:hypothetical protein
MRDVTTKLLRVEFALPSMEQHRRVNGAFRRDAAII